jgi:hypothetical protein
MLFFFFCDNFFCLAIAALLHVWSPFNMGLGACVTLTPVILVLSAAWSPHLQAAIVKVKACKGKGHRVDSRAENVLVPNYQ